MDYTDTGSFVYYGNWLSISGSSVEQFPVYYDRPSKDIQQIIFMRCEQCSSTYVVNVTKLDGITILKCHECGGKLVEK